MSAEILAAVEHAEKAPPPPPDSLVTEVYADVPWHLRRQWDELQEIRRGA
jgi:TPP-dependent pyruvate/acetoin dehydrogenase alpha subunit